MSQKKFYFAAIVGLLAFYGCSDDSTINNVPKGCTSNSQCASGICLEDGQCVILVNEGSDCDDVNRCKDGLECKSGTCQSTSAEPDPECSEDSECNDGKVCHEGTCQEPAGPASECSEDAECNEGEICKEGSCQEPEILGECNEDSHCDENKTCMNHICVAKEGECHEDTDCVGDADNPICMPDGNCGHFVLVGEMCGVQAYCGDGYECMGVCYEKLHEGDACDPEDTLHVCDIESGANCYDGQCRVPVFDIAIGNECHDVYMECAKGLTCLANKCVQLQGENQSCDESNHMVCGSGMECIKSVCTPVGKECKKTSECTENDSFCCTSDSCGAKGRCIPYDDTVTHDDTCMFKTKPGIFEAQVQCRWQPPAKSYPDSKMVEMPPLVGHFGNSKKIKTTIAVFSFKTRGREEASGNSKPITEEQAETVIRFINPENCETLESIRVNLSHWWNNYPAAADLNGNGYLDFVVATRDHYARAYTWNEKNKKHEVLWTAKVDSNGPIMIYDLDGDGNAEVIGGTSVINGQTGATIFAGSNGGSTTYAIGNLDRDPKGIATQLRANGLWKWNTTDKKWVRYLTFNDTKSMASVGYADFGTPGATADKFNFNKLDGYPEFVLTGNGKLLIKAAHKTSDGKYEEQDIMNVSLLASVDDASQPIYGGPVTIGDFNKDGLPEVGIASTGYFGVYDPKCKKYEAGKCADKGVLWERVSQDASSGRTGSSLFDFDGDGQSEAVYADECFTRVYDGQTGKVLFSARRSSSTSIEAPVIVDVDDDGSAEILMGSDNNQSCYNDKGEKLGSGNKNNNAVDPIHEGIRCLDDEDCPTSKNCNKTIHLCTCTSDDECNSQYIKVDGKDKILQQYVCAEPIHSDVGMMINSDGKGRKMAQKRGTRPKGWKDGDYKVCRATRKYEDIGVSDLMIFRDRLDRWVSSRNMWNQHAYNIINIEDNGKMPTPQKWLDNWLLKSTEKKTSAGDPAPVYNNYRLNSQGKYGAGMAPDITGRFLPDSICGTSKNAEGKDVHLISGNLCNRGTKPVGDKLPATFFYYDESKPDHRGKKICTSYTKKVVGVGECSIVGCEISEEDLQNIAGKKVLLVSNLDEHGFAATIECNTDNNTDSIVVDDCSTPIIIN